jgi:ribosomal protein L18E
MRPTEKIEKFLQKASVTSNPNVNKAVLNELTEEMEKTKQTGASLNIWRILMKSPITKFAAAAVIVIGIFLGINYFGGSVSSVAWARVAENVEQINTFKFNLKIIVHNNDPDKPAEDTQAQWTIYLSSKFGFRMDIGNKDNVVSWYVPIEKDKIITVIPAEKKWGQMPFSDDYARQWEKDDPRDYIKRFMSCKYTELGRQTIDGIEVEGIEVINPPTDIEHLENAVGRLWVDVKTQLPIQVEIKGNVDRNTVQCNMDFRWDEEFDANIFQIPSDYTPISQ